MTDARNAIKIETEHDVLARMNQALQHALRTPPQPRQPKTGGAATKASLARPPKKEREASQASG